MTAESLTELAFYDYREGETIRAREKQFGDLHTEVASTLDEYAKLLRKMNRNEEAEKMEQRVSTIREQIARC